MNKIDKIINVIKNYPQVQIKRKDVLDIHNRLPYNYQSKTGYETLIQNVILENLIIIMGATIVDIDIEIK